MATSEDINLAIDTLDDLLISSRARDPTMPSAQNPVHTIPT